MSIEAMKRALELANEGVEIHSPNSPEYKVCAALIEAEKNNTLADIETVKRALEQTDAAGFFSREAMKAHSDCNMTRLENTEQKQWSNLTKEERGEFVQRICNTGTMFVTPLFSIINEIEWLIWEKNK